MLSPTSQDRQERQDSQERDEEGDGNGNGNGDEDNWDWDAVSDASRHASMIRKCKQTEFVVEGTSCFREAGGMAIIPCTL